jgi:hypothetical protein
VFYRDNITIPAQEVSLFDMVLTGERLDPFRYFGYWIWEMSRRIYGIFGDMQLYAKDVIVPFYIFYFLVASVVGICSWKKIKKEAKYISAISIFYMLVLLIVQNYDMYLKRGYPALALQGRYIFPVIVPFYILLVLFLNKIKSKWLRAAVFAGLTILFVIGCWIFFFRNVDVNWFGSIVY